MNFSQHKSNWKSCAKCDLHKCRRNVVLLRGTVPAPLLFIGEAPGESEDVLGRPFIGPAGKLLDQIIRGAGLTKGEYAVTNIIACIPRDENGDKLIVPPAKAVKTCADRLNECVNLVSPQLIVCVGQESKKWCPKVITDWEHYNTTDIIHPAAILRANIAQQGLMVQRAVVTLANSLEDLR